MSSPFNYNPRPGVSYSGTYEVRDGMVYVTARGHVGRPTQVGGSPPETIARMILGEMVGKFGLEPDPA
jgi:hypothetical protein